MAPGWGLIHLEPLHMTYMNVHEHAAESLPSPSGPDLHGHHGLLGADGREQVLLAQELKRKLDQEAADLLQLLAGAGRVLLVQARLAQVALQLQDVADVAGRQAAENLEPERREGGLVTENWFQNDVKQELV